eukprot:Opistho-1_new@67815
MRSSTAACARVRLGSEGSSLELRVVGRAEASDGVPAGGRVEAVLLAVVVAALGNVVERLGVLVEEGVEEAERALALLHAEVVQEANNAGKHGRRRRRARNQLDVAILDDGIVDALSRDIGETTAVGIVVRRGGEGALLRSKVRRHGRVLVRRRRGAGEVVRKREAAAGPVHALLLSAAIELRGTDGRNRRQAGGERGVEAGGAARARVDARVAAGKDDAHAEKAELLELLVEALGVVGGDLREVLTVRDGPDKGRVVRGLDGGDPADKVEVEAADEPVVRRDALAAHKNVLDVEVALNLRGSLARARHLAHRLRGDVVRRLELGEVAGRVRLVLELSKGLRRVRLAAGNVRDAVELAEERGRDVGLGAEDVVFADVADDGEVVEASDKVNRVAHGRREEGLLRGAEDLDTLLAVRVDVDRDAKELLGRGGVRREPDEVVVACELNLARVDVRGDQPVLHGGDVLGGRGNERRELFAREELAVVCVAGIADGLEALRDHIAVALLEREREGDGLGALGTLTDKPLAARRADDRGGRQAREGEGEGQRDRNDVQPLHGSRCVFP